MRSLRGKSLFERFVWGFEAYSGIKITNAYRQAKWGGGTGFLIGKQNQHNTQCYRRVWRKENHFPGGSHILGSASKIEIIFNIMGVFG